MIVFRNADWRRPFLWETHLQPAARYHSEDDGPAQYFADTPDGAWAEFLRHAEITDPDELSEIKRSLWAVRIPEANPAPSFLPGALALGGKDSYSACQSYARGLRDKGQLRIHEQSAALKHGGARGHRVKGGLQNGPARDGITIVIFEYLPESTGWRVCTGGPPIHVAALVQHF